jgi:excinuclease ABC subunit C
MTETTNSFVDLPDFLSKLTTAPGVYRMLDANNVVLYVGKAANLKKRVNSYFNRPTSSSKTRALVEQINHIEVSVTRSETEALLLESNLIKSLRPKYNILMRDDKTYPYLTLSKTHPYPRLSAIRSKKKPENGLFFGPYPSISALRETLNVIQKVFKIRNCTDSYFNARARPCLQYQIKRCSAPCTGYITPENYQHSVSQAIALLEGKCNQLLDTLAQQMDDSVARLAFEEAAVVRDQIKSLRLVQEQQGMARMEGDADVIVIDARPGFACVQCVRVRDGQVLESQHFFPSVPKLNFDDTDDLQSLWQQVFSVFIAYHYIDRPSLIPPLIVTNQSIDDQPILQAMLSQYRGKSCKIQTHPRGVKARWVDFAMNNLQLAISEHTASAKMIKTRYETLRDVLRLEKPPQSMVCFDISHTQGASTVASCVAFDSNGPCKREYRRYNISGITPGDDYAAMEQALLRHFKQLSQAKKQLPDVLVIDGGKGQVAVAKRVLSELSIEGITLLGIAKGPSRKAGLEHLILDDGVTETTLPSDSPALHLLQHIRDESHRFAITAHKKRRQKASLGSSLETIEGVGVKRHQALLRRFGGLRELAKAPIEEIAKTQGISQELAERIYRHFH